MEVLIVGAGIGGLALAYFLRKQGHMVSIIEKSLKVHHAGFSIGMWANGRAILRELGIEQKIIKKGSITRTYKIVDKEGHTLIEYDLKKHLKNYWPAEVQVKRDYFYRLLLQKARGIPLKRGVTIRKLKQSRDKVNITFSDNRKKAYDLVVGADGMHSQVREMLFGTNCIEDLGLKGYWIWISRKPPFKKSNEVFEVIAENQFFGTYPHGVRQTCAYLVRYRDSNEKRTHILEEKEIQTRFPDILRLIPGLKEEIQRKSESIRVDTVERINLDQWYKGRVVLLGDAAHGFETFAGIGGAMALEDAYILAQKCSTEKNIPLALKNYQEQRKPRVALARHETEKLRKWKIQRSALTLELEEYLLPFVPLSYFTEEYETLLGQKV